MKVLLSTINSDSHTWNLVFMQLYLEEMGFEVVNLGSCVPNDLLLKQAHQHKPDMIVISSVNGHANIEGVELAKSVRACDLLRNTKLVIGGKLGTEGINNNKYADKLIDAGFDMVFIEENGLQEFDSYLRQLDYGFPMAANS